MANKTHALELVDAGLSNNEIAKILKCTTAYVRATRYRRDNPGRYEQEREYKRNRYRTDAKWRERAKKKRQRVAQSRRSIDRTSASPDARPA